MSEQLITCCVQVKGEHLLEQILPGKARNQPSIHELMIANGIMVVLLIIAILVIVKLL
jgi:hypothetical protein